MKEMDQLQQQAGLHREELEAEVQKIREDESFLRDHLSISVKVLIWFGDICNGFLSAFNVFLILFIEAKDSPMNFDVAFFPLNTTLSSVFSKGKHAQ